MEVLSTIILPIVGMSNTPPQDGESRGKNQGEEMRGSKPKMEV